MSKKPLPPTGWLRAIDPSGRREPRQVGTGHGRGSVAVAHGAIWVANSASRSLARLDADTLEMTAAFELGKVPVAIGASADAIWLLGGNGWLWRVHRSAPSAEGVARLGRHGRALAATDRTVWTLREGGELARVDPVSGEVTMETRVGRGARKLVAKGDAVWATSGRGRTLVRVEPQSGAIDSKARLTGRAVSLALHGAELWILGRHLGARRGGMLWAIDARTGEPREEHEVAQQPRALAASPDAIWIATGIKGKREGKILRLDRRSGSMETIDETSQPVNRLAVAGSQVLATLSYGVNNYAEDGRLVMGDGVFGELGGGGDGGGGGGGGDGGGGGGGGG